MGGRPAVSRAGLRGRIHSPHPGRPPHYPASVEFRRLGRTGHRSSVAVLGGAAFWDTEPDVAGQALSSAVDAGVNHLDVAPQYGRAEELLGPHLPALRDRLFVAGKTLRHSRDGVRRAARGLAPYPALRLRSISISCTP